MKLKMKKIQNKKSRQNLMSSSDMKDDGKENKVTYKNVKSDKKFQLKKCKKKK